MEPTEATDRDKRLLAQMVETLPPATTVEEHREAITSLLALFERLHLESGAALPGWLKLGKHVYSRERTEANVSRP